MNNKDCDYLAENLEKVVDYQNDISNQYIANLYASKAEIYSNIMIKENNGYYLINGYHLKGQDIKRMIDLDNMIDEYNIDEKMIWNDITRSMSFGLKIDPIYFKKLSFREFVKKLKIEKDIILHNSFGFTI